MQTNIFINKIYILYLVKIFVHIQKLKSRYIDDEFRPIDGFVQVI